MSSARSGLAIALGVLLFRRLSLLLLVVVAGPQPLLWLLCEGRVWLQPLHQLWSPLVVGFIVGGLVTLVRVDHVAFELVEGSLPACF